jgi:hypothetical protein
LNRGVGVTISHKRRKRTKAEKGNRTTRLLAEAARVAAKQRLKEIFPELYQTLLAEERAKRGLEPWPIETAHVIDDDTRRTTMDFAEVYAALDVDFGDEETGLTQQRNE